MSSYQASSAEGDLGGNFMDGLLAKQQSLSGSGDSGARAQVASSQSSQPNIATLPHLGDLLETELMILGLQARRVYEDEI